MACIASTQMPISDTRVDSRESLFVQRKDILQQATRNLTGGANVAIYYSVALAELASAYREILAPKEKEYQFDPVRIPPSQEAIDCFLRLTRLLKRKGITPRRYAALEEGGIMVYYSKSDLRVTFEIGNDGELAFIKQEPGKPTLILDVDIKDFESSILKAFE